MASRSQSWFDNHKLLAGETLIREAPVRLRTPSPPGWWEGTLVLTSDRLFFLPRVRNPMLEEDIAFWLTDLEEAPAGRNQMRVHRHGSDTASVTFDFPDTLLGLRSLFGERGRSWIHAIRRARPDARPADAFVPRAPRRAAAG